MYHALNLVSVIVDVLLMHRNTHRIILTSSGIAIFFLAFV